MIIGARDRGEFQSQNISWYTRITDDIGGIFLLDTKLSGSIDYFYRKREGLRGRKYDVLVPSE